MKKKIFKVSAYLVAGFALMFLFRLWYSYSESNTYDSGSDSYGFFDSSVMSRKNYASDSYRYKKAEVSMKDMKEAEAPATNGEISISQKYEKTATIRAKTENYDNDEKQLRADIKKFNAIVQYEEKTGSKGSRNLSMMIGVKPENFDSFYVVLKKTGSIRQADIEKIDKTNEYRQLNAKKASLEKTRQSLVDLKKQSGKIDEFINLENRILEIEDQLQELGVSIGDFDEENEFCTIKYALSEGKTIKQSFIHRVKVSLEWAILYYCWMMLTFVALLIVAFLFLLVVEKLQILQAIMKKINS